MKKVLVVSLALLLVACGKDDIEDGQVIKEELPNIENSSQNEIVSKQENEETRSEERLDEKVDENSESKVGQEQPKMVSHEEFKKIIDYNMLSDGDELLSSSVDGSELRAVVKLEDGAFKSSMMAASSYSALSDELLTHEGWDTLIVEFVDIGSISMNRNERETNEFGLDYFPVAKIESNFKNN